MKEKVTHPFDRALLQSTAELTVNEKKKRMKKGGREEMKIENRKGRKNSNSNSNSNFLPLLACLLVA